MFMGSRAAALLAALALALALAVPASAAHCPFCASSGQTLLGETNQATFIVFGTLSNAKRDPNEFGKGTTDLDIEIVVKDHEFLKGKKKLTLPRYVPPDPKSPTKHLLFCDLFKGEIDPYRGEAVPPDSKVAEYLKGAIAVKEKDPTTRLLYFFQHFDSPEWSVSGDAFQEFSNADYKDVRAAAVKMDPDALMKMLKEPGTSISRFGLIGLLLGHTGKADVQGKALRTFIDDPKVKQATGLDGLLAGYLLLDPKAGLEFMDKLINDKNEDFLVRYAALRTVRFFWEYRADVLDRSTIVKTVLPLLDQADIVDLAVEDLRKWEQWPLTAKIVGLFDKPSHEASIIQRSIIKFALAAPSTDKPAAEFLARLRKDEKQAERVHDLEQLLELEKPRPAVAVPAKK